MSAAEQITQWVAIGTTAIYCRSPLLISEPANQLSGNLTGLNDLEARATAKRDLCSCLDLDRRDVTFLRVASLGGRFAMR
jgi:hypothetical protein